MQPIGKYEVIAEIGSGSMGTIYEARDPMLDRAVALKVLRSGPDLDPELKERFYREARACARLSHPNIIAVYDLGESGGALFIAMELLSGSDVRKLLKEKRTPSLAVMLDLMAQVCDALEHAHGQQLVHRDIKPSNIFVCSDNRAKVLDFGIAKFPTSNLTMAGTVLGSPNYMSPEQIRGGKCDSRSDLFSAAIVFYEFAAGVHPFQDDFIPRRIVSAPPDSLREKNPEAPEALESLLLQALEKDPDKRIRTAGEFAAGLRAVRAALKSSPPVVVTVPVEPAPTRPIQVTSTLETVMMPAPPPAATPPAATAGRLEFTARRGGDTTLGRGSDTTAGRADATAGRADTTPEQRVSEFLRVVGDFDEGIDKRDSQAARAALEEMRQLAAVDTRFVVAVSDCESRLNELTPSKGAPVAPFATTTPAKAPLPAAPGPISLPEPPRVAVGKTPIGKKKSNTTALVAAAAVLFLLIAAAAFVKLRRSPPAEKPAPVAAAPVAPAVATAVVNPPTADLLDTPNASGKRLGALHHGETLQVIALPSARDQEFTNVRTVDNPLAGYVRTAELSEWSGANAEAAFTLASIFAAPDTGNEAELNAKLEQWNGLIGRYPASSHLPEANLNAGRIEMALGRLGKSEGKPAAEWQPHFDRAKQALASVTGAPALESQVADLQKQLAHPDAPTAGTGTSASTLLRGKVSSLWDEGQYEAAMAIVDQILASSPNNQEALSWKNKIRASQEAEASVK
jgi:hypothetical protein